MSVPYCGSAPDPTLWLTRWNLDPVLLLLLLSGFAIGWRHAADRRRLAGAFGLSVLLFVSPLCALSSALFSVRVSHHLALAGLLAPMIAWALPLRASRPWLWTIGQALLFWAWHAPAPYAAALGSDGLYWLMEASLLVSATGFWAAVRASSLPLGLAALVITMMQMGLLGALITFAPTPIYAPHLLTTRAWSLSPLEDQQLAGLMMWVVGGLLYLFAALTLVWRALEPRPHPAAAR